MIWKPKLAERLKKDQRHHVICDFVSAEVKKRDEKI